MSKQIKGDNIKPVESTPIDAIKIDVTLIPDHVRDAIAATVYESVVNYFRQPGSQEKFEAWQAEREKKGGGASPNEGKK